MNTPPSTPPSCPTPGENNWYHLKTRPEDNLCVRIMRVVAYVFLHILTFGFFLLLHYYQKHTSKESPIILPVSPQTPLPDTPPTPTLPPQQETLTPELQPTPPQPESPKPDKPKDIFPPVSDLIARIKGIGRLPEGVAPHSLEAMVCNEEQGLAPLNARSTVEPGGHFNPTFLATYPRRICRVFENTLKNLKKHILPDPLQDDHSQVSQMIVNQLEYLNQNYDIVDVPGDGNCFYRSFFVGWLCSLLRTDHPQNAFLTEATRILSLPFASSSPENQALTEKMIAILTSCQHYSDLKSLYDEKILSPENTRTAIQYLRELAIFTRNENRAQALGGEENLRALILAQMEENPEMLVDYLEELIKTHPTSPILTETYTDLPLSAPADQAMLLVECFPYLLHPNSDTYALPPQMVQELIDLFSTALSLLPQQEENLDVLITFFPPEIKGHWDKFSQENAAITPKTLLFLSFLLSHPSCVYYYPECTDVYESAQQAFREALSGTTKLADALGWDTHQETLLGTLLQTVWQQKQSSSILENILRLNGAMRPGTVLPQVKRVFTTAVRLFAEAPRSLSDSQVQNLVNKLEIFIQADPFLSKEYTATAFSSLKASLQDKALSPAYAKGILMMVFLLQHPHLITHPQLGQHAQRLALLLLPHMEQALRHPVNAARLDNLALSIQGIFFCHTPEINLEDTPLSTIVIESTLLCFARSPEELTACSPVLRSFLLNTLDCNDPTTADMLQSIQTHHPDLLEKHKQHLNRVGQKAFEGSTTTLSSLLPESLLLFSFLCRYEHALHPDLHAQCADYMKVYQTHIQQYLLFNLPECQHAILTHAQRLNHYSLLQKSFLFSLARPSNTYPEYHQALLSYLGHMEIQQLVHLFDRVNTQAEDEHVSGISSALGSLALCQYLGDVTLTQTPSQLAPLASTYGFIQTDYTPEAQASIHLFRANNHYNCLIRKDQNTN